jgi:hypothetical protein
MIRLTKNLREQIFQYVPSFAAEENATKVYTTIASLEQDITNKKHIYPGKIVYVFETKQFYIIDLLIAGNKKFSDDIKNAWINQITLLQGVKDIVTTDYELVGFVNKWTYEPLFSTRITVPEENGKIMISKNGEIAWIENEIRFIGNIGITPTLITAFDLIPLQAMKIYLLVNGVKNGNISCSYTSTIILNKNNNEAQISEYGIINTNNLDIDFSCSFDNINEKWNILIKKNEHDYVIQNTIMKIQIMSFL